MMDKENETEDIISVDAVRDFLLKHNGKAPQVELVNHFRSQLNSPSTKVRARQEFKDILQLITAIKTENGEKFVVLTKQNQQASVVTRKPQRPLSIRKEICRSRGENLMVPFNPRVYDVSDEEDNTPSHAYDSGMGSDTSSIRSVSSLRSDLAQKISTSKSVESFDTAMGDGDDEDDLEDDLGLNEIDEVLPEEKDWMMAAANGDLCKLKKLLDTYPVLAQKKDFVMGYTALHWAAKLGRPDIIKFIMTAGVDIHSKSHGGYSPLHIAAMSGRDQVIVQLIELYSANIHVRDHSGKKPRDVVRETVAADVQRKLGRSLVLVPDSGDARIMSSLRRPMVRSRPSSDEELTSPIGTPEVMRRNLKSIGASAQRSMSFLKKKKKDRLRAEDIQMSPRGERRPTAALPVERKSSLPWKVESRKISADNPSQTNGQSKPTVSGLGESVLTFEI